MRDEVADPTNAPGTARGREKGSFRFAWQDFSETAENWKNLNRHRRGQSGGEKCNAAGRCEGTCLRGSHETCSKSLLSTARQCLHHLCLSCGGRGGLFITGPQPWTTALDRGCGEKPRQPLGQKKQRRGRAQGRGTGGTLAGL